jgi:hypothetical protein
LSCPQLWVFIHYEFLNLFLGVHENQEENRDGLFIFLLLLQGWASHYEQVILVVNAEVYFADFSLAICKACQGFRVKALMEIQHLDLQPLLTYLCS